MKSECVIANSFLARTREAGWSIMQKFSESKVRCRALFTCRTGGVQNTIISMCSNARMWIMESCPTWTTNQPDQKTFMSAWRTERYWIQIASRTSMFVGCACCKLLQNLLSSTSRANDATMQALRHRLGRRYAFQSAQRLADEKLMEQCRRSNKLEWLLSNKH